MSYVNIMYTETKNYTFLFILTGINYETAGTSPGSRKSSYFLVNQKQKWKMFKTRYIVAYVHPREMDKHDCFSCNAFFPAITFFLWYVTSEH